MRKDYEEDFRQEDMKDMKGTDEGASIPDPSPVSRPPVKQ